MKEPYISRRYLREKYNHIKFAFEEALDVENQELPDKIPYEKVRQNLGDILDAWESISCELTKKPILEDSDIVPYDKTGKYTEVINETHQDLVKFTNALHDFIVKENIKYGKTD
jgi:hypothetical protein